MVEITKVFLEKMHASDDFIEWINKQKEVDSTTIIGKLIKENKFYYANFLLERLFTKEQFLKYLIYVVKIILPILGEDHPDYRILKKAIKLVKKNIKLGYINKLDATYGNYDIIYLNPGSNPLYDDKSYQAEIYSKASYAITVMYNDNAFYNDSIKYKKDRNKIIKYGIELLKDFRGVAQLVEQAVVTR